MSLIIDALKKAQQERKRPPLKETKWGGLKSEKPKKVYYFLLIGAVCATVAILLIPVPQKTKTGPLPTAQVSNTEPSLPRLSPGASKEAKGDEQPQTMRETKPKAETSVKEEEKTEKKTEKKKATPMGKSFKSYQEEDSTPEPEEKGVFVQRHDEERITGIYNQATAEAEKGNTGEAKKLYQMVLAEKPYHVEALNNLGVIAMKEDNGKEAIAYFRKILEKKPDYAKAYNNIGIVHMREGEKSLAEEYFRKSINIDKDNTEAYINLTTLLRANRRYQEASNMLETLIQKGNRDPALSLSIALIKDEMGQSKEAITYYRYYLLQGGKKEERNKVIERLKTLEEGQSAKYR